MNKSLLALLLVGCVPQVCCNANAAERLNIVFLLSDDQTARAIGCAGNLEIHTPHLDQLAAEGTRFTNHYNTTSICMASRCCVMTGLYEYRHGCNFEHGDLQRSLFANSYAARLRQAGYFTGFAGKAGFVLEGEKFDTLAAEFDHWAGGPGQTFYETAKNAGIARYADRYPHCSRAYAAWGIDFLKSAKHSGQPFCLNISFKAPHLPFTPDPLDVPLYAGRKFSRPANDGVARGTHLSAQSRTSRAATDYREWVNDYDHTVARYYALITGVDAAVGMIRAGLKQEGLADNTVIIFTSDNGYNSGSHGFGDKVLPYEEGSKSPLIIYDPRLPAEYAGQVSPALTANVDMAATILSVAEVPVPEGMDGLNLIPLLTDPQASVREYLPLFNFWGTASAQSMAIVTPQWKYIYWYYGAEGFRPTEELFFLENDRIEMVNLLASDHSVSMPLKRLRSYYEQELIQMQARLISGHHYEHYPTLFNPREAWARKALLLPELKVK